MATLQKGAFQTVSVKVGDDRSGSRGRSQTRNEMADMSDADWLFFLDADDLMHPKALANVAPYTQKSDAIFGQILELKEGVVVPRYQVPALKTYEELLSFDPYQTIQMGHFVRREVFQSLRFNEDMDVGEDWDYYLRLWKYHDCLKIEDPLMINIKGSHSTGPRSATGRRWTEVVGDMVDKARTAMSDGDGQD